MAQGKPEDQDFKPDEADQEFKPDDPTLTDRMMGAASSAFQTAKEAYQSPTGVWIRNWLSTGDPTGKYPTVGGFSSEPLPFVPSGETISKKLTGHEPETWMGGFTKGLYDEFIAPLISQEGILGSASIGAPRNIFDVPYRVHPGEEALIRSRSSGPLTVAAEESPIVSPKLLNSTPPGLPAARAGTPVTPPAGPFVGGEAGIAEPHPYPIDITPTAPPSGTTLPSEAGEIVQIPPDLAARRGIGGLGQPLKYQNMPGPRQLPAAPGFFVGPEGGAVPIDKTINLPTAEAFKPDVETINRAATPTEAAPLEKVPPVPDMEKVPEPTMPAGKYDIPYNRARQWRGELPPHIKGLLLADNNQPDAQALTNEAMVKTGRDIGLDVDNMSMDEIHKELSDLAPRSLSDIERARSERGGIKMGAQLKRLGDMLANALYENGNALVSTKELIQNSGDAVRRMGPAGHIEVKFNRKDEYLRGNKNTYIEVKDNGPGLTRDGIETVFIDLASSGKENDPDATGGFGMAKASPWLGSRKSQVETIAREPDGRIMKYNFTINKDKVFEHIPVRETQMPAGTPTGTRVKVFTKKGADLESAYNVAKNMATKSTGLSSRFTLTQVHPRYKNAPDTVENLTPPGHSEYDIQTLSDPIADVDVMIPKNTRMVTRKGLPFHVMNNGIWQHGAQTGYEEGHDIPEDVYVNVRSKVKEGDEDYPFTMNREALRGKIKSLISNHLYNTIVAPARDRAKNQLKYIWDNMQPVQIPGTHNRQFFVYDTGKRMTQEERDAFANHPVVQQFGRNISEITEAVLGSSGHPDWEKKLTRVGIIIDDSLKGVHIPDPNKPGDSAIFINPFSNMRSSETGALLTPMQAASSITHTIKHEVAHIAEPYHNESFAWRLANLHAAFDAEQEWIAASSVATDITDASTGQYLPEVQDVLQRYDAVRWRPASTDDPLIRSGTGARNKKPPRKNPVPSTPESDRERAAAIQKLTNAVRIAKPIRELQEELYTAERARRMRRVMRVKTRGLEGYFQQLSRMAGELPKVKPADYGLTNHDVDVLIDAITDSGRIGPWEKLNAKEGLVKLLSGQVPQRSELSLMGRVFGGDFTDAVMMHGGILGPVSFRALAEVSNAMKTAKASIDLSAPFRQGAGLIHTRAFWRAYLKMWKAAFSESYYDDLQQMMENHPQYQLARQSGLQLTDMHDILSREEQFLSKIITEMPGNNPLSWVYNKSVGALFRGSERGYVAFLNQTRFDAFVDLVKKAQQSGLKPFEMDPVFGKGGKVVDWQPIVGKVTEDLATVINNSTGRGSLGRFNKVATELNALFFSPRFIASRMNMFFNPGYYNKLEPFARREAIKSIMALGGMYLAFTGLAMLIGGEFGKKLFAADFMKTRFRNTRLDPSAGVLNYFNNFLRFAAGRTDSSIATGPLAPSRKDILLNTVGNLTSPMASLVLKIISAKPNKEGQLANYGRPLNVPQEILNSFVPMFTSDVYEVYKANPDLFPYGDGHFGTGKFDPVMATLPMAFHGHSLNTYQESQPKSRLRLK